MSDIGVSLLRDDDSLLRQIFLKVFSHHHPTLANRLDLIYAMSQAWCQSGSESDFEMLNKYLEKLKPEETILVRELCHLPPRHCRTPTSTSNEGRVACAAVCTRDQGSPIACSCFQSLDPLSPCCSHWVLYCRTVGCLLALHLTTPPLLQTSVHSSSSFM